MLHIFLMNRGCFKRLEIQLRFHNVKTLRNAICERFKVPENQQILLVSGGHLMETEVNVCEYSAGDDESNPIYVFTSECLQSTYRPKPDIHTVDARSYLRELESLSPDRLPPSQHLLQSRVTLLGDVEVKIVSVCCQAMRSTVQEQHALVQGWAVALANMEEAKQIFGNRVTSLHGRLTAFETHFEQYQDTLAQFESARDTLSAIPLLASLLPSTPPLTPCPIDLLDPPTLAPEDGSSLSLYSWIAGGDSGGNSLTARVNEARLALDVLANQLNLYHELENARKLIDLTRLDPISDYVDPNYFAERLDHLQPALKACTDYASAINTARECMESDQRRVTGICEGDIRGILPEMSRSHGHQMQRVGELLEKLSELVERCSRSKCELVTNITERQKWLTKYQTEMSQLTQKMLKGERCVRVVTTACNLVTQLTTASGLYAQSVTEVLRRRLLLGEYRQWSGCVCDGSRAIYEEEKERRSQFDALICDHFLRNLFSKLVGAKPPSYGLKEPVLVDDQLPEVTKEDIELLAMQVPLLADQLRSLLKSSSTHNAAAVEVFQRFSSVTHPQDDHTTLSPNRPSSLTKLSDKTTSITKSLNSNSSKTRSQSIHEDELIDSAPFLSIPPQSNFCQDFLSNQPSPIQENDDPFSKLPRVECSEVGVMTSMCADVTSMPQNDSFVTSQFIEAVEASTQTVPCETRVFSHSPPHSLSRSATPQSKYNEEEDGASVGFEPRRSSAIVIHEGSRSQPHEDASIGYSPWMQVGHDAAMSGGELVSGSPVEFVSTMDFYSITAPGRFSGDEEDLEEGDLVVTGARSGRHAPPMDASFHSTHTNMSPTDGVEASFTRVSCSSSSDQLTALQSELYKSQARVLQLESLLSSMRALFFVSTSSLKESLSLTKEEVENFKQDQITASQDATNTIAETCHQLETLSLSEIASLRSIHRDDLESERVKIRELELRLANQRDEADTELDKLRRELIMDSELSMENLRAEHQKEISALESNLSDMRLHQSSVIEQLKAGMSRSHEDAIEEVKREMKEEMRMMEVKYREEKEQAVRDALENVSSYHAADIANLRQDFSEERNRLIDQLSSSVQIHEIDRLKQENEELNQTNSELNRNLCDCRSQQLKDRDLIRRLMVESKTSPSTSPSQNEMAMSRAMLTSSPNNFGSISESTMQSQYNPIMEASVANSPQNQASSVVRSVRFVHFRFRSDDLVLFVPYSRSDQWVMLSSDSELYFLHDDSYHALGLIPSRRRVNSSSEAAPSRPSTSGGVESGGEGGSNEGRLGIGMKTVKSDRFLLAVYRSREKCQARKVDNRFNLPVNFVFYRVKARAISEQRFAANLLGVSTAHALTASAHVQFE